MEAPMEDVHQEKQRLEGQATVWRCIYGLVDAMALKCAVDFGIADVINSHGHPISLTQIIESMNHHPPPDPARLCRVMALLVGCGIFTATTREDSETLYGLTEASKWILRGKDKSLAKLLSIETDPAFLSCWQYLGDCIKEGCTGFKKSYGMAMWDFMATRPELASLLHEGMDDMTKSTIESVIKLYVRNGGLHGAGSVVDVGGGSGALLFEIVKELPHIKAINYDLAQTIAQAQKSDGVSFVAGDMFTFVPRADAILLKWVLHNWDDNKCIKILENCRKALPEKGGKLIIIEAVLEPQGQDLFEKAKVGLDLTMMICFDAKERTEPEWKILLEKAGFPRYNIIKLPEVLSIIEAYPN